MASLDPSTTNQANPWQSGPQDRPGPAWHHLLPVLALVILGTMVGSLGTVGLPVGHNISVFWPAMTLQVAGGLWFGGWGVLGGVVLAFLSNLLTGGSVANLLGFVPANLIQSGLCVWAFRRWHFNPALPSKKDLAAFVLWGAFLPNLFGSCLGVLALWAGGEITTMGHALTLIASWLLGNGLPCLLLGLPLLKAFSPLVMDSPFFCKTWWGTSRPLRRGKMSLSDLPVAARLLLGFGAAGVLPIFVVTGLGSISAASNQEPDLVMPVMLNLSIFLSLIVSGLVSNNIGKRVKVLEEAAHRLGRGDLESRALVLGGDELGSLAKTFNRMAHDLARSQEDLKRSTAERERYQKELEIAHGIQQSFLPQSFPRIPGYEIAAINLPARHVGGDFYDFIPLKDGRWGLVVADVSDKGVPAALFMALSRSLVKAYSLQYESVLEALNAFNAFVEADNPSAMFVTLFYAVLNAKDRHLSYINAGHNPPVIVRQPDRQVIMLSAKGMALGVWPEVNLEEHPIQMEPGDVLVLYTDGITEAFNKNGEMFGLEGLVELVKANQDLNATELSRLLTRAVLDFTGDQPQSDDITLMVLRCLS